MSKVDEQDKRIEQIFGRFDVPISKKACLKYITRF